MVNTSIYLIVLIFIVTSLPAWSNERNIPNIILILADDMGYGDLAIQNPQSKIPTPNLDKLATAGMRFTDAHSPSAVCTPTRYGILTGRYSWRGQLKKGVLWEWDKPLIEPDRVTIADLLNGAGYDTALIGKWHLGWNWPTKGVQLPRQGDTGENVDFNKPLQGGPLAAGFDYYFGDDVPNFPPYAYIENEHVTEIPTVMKPDSMYGIKGLMVKDWDLRAVMPEIAKRTISYIENHAAHQSSRPFFLFVSLTAPHTPIAPAEEYLGKSSAGAYGDFVYQIDQTVGGILDALETSGQDKNTLVIFTSDNGSPGRDGENMGGDTSTVLAYGHDPSRPWRGIKGDAWEGGHRVPFIARWPDKISANTRSKKPILLTDLFATVADIIETKLPVNAGEDSLSLLPVFTGAKQQASSRAAIVQHSYDGLFVIRQDKWKLIQGYGGGGINKKKEEPRFWEQAWQLYYLATDPGENNNVAADNPEIVQQLSDLLKLYKKEGRSVFTQ
jgi:arylsulfatase A-like enzyme